MSISVVVMVALVVFLIADLVWLAAAILSDHRDRVATIREERLRIRREETRAERQLFAVSEHALREMLRVAREDAAQGRDGDQ